MPTEKPSTVHPNEEQSREENTLRKALELSSRKHLPRFSLDDLLSRVPNDWVPGEDDVDEFLNSIRDKAPR